MLDRLKLLGLGDIEARIRYERIVDPTEWRDEFFVHEGATFNLAHDLMQMLYFRPHNRFGPGLYLVGGGTHPGSGLPVIYEGARITARLLIEELSARARRGRQRRHPGHRAPGRLGRRHLRGLSRPLAGLCALLLVSGAARAASVAVEVEGIEPGGPALRRPVPGRPVGGRLPDGAAAPSPGPPPSASSSERGARHLRGGGLPGHQRQRPPRPDRPRPAPRALRLLRRVARSARPDFARARFAVREPGVGVRVRLSRALPPR